MKRKLTRASVDELRRVIDRNAQQQFSNNVYNSFYIFYEQTNSYISY